MLFFGIFVSYGQESNSINSLKEKLILEEDPKTRTQMLFEIGDLYYSTQRDSSIFYLTQSYHLSKQVEDLNLRSRIAGLLGVAYQVVDIEKSTEYLFEALAIAEESNGS
tara:strand:+ start:404 stop:730 length:327 start_codon:yes stop_codon:yes gene_type:complete